jgi:DNA-binding NarL/FixJ family response regulator
MSFLNDAFRPSRQKVPFFTEDDGMLAGQTVLIVEAQYLIALDLQNSLDDLAPGKVVIAQDPVHAKEIEHDWSDCTLAIVEIERELAQSVAFAGELVRNGVPVIVLTADPDLHQSLNWWAGTQILLKPVPAENVTAAVAAVIADQNE